MIVFSFFSFVRDSPGFLSRLVFTVQNLCPVNVFLLSALGTATEQDDKCVAIPGKVNTVTRPPVDDVFSNAVKPLYAGCIS